LRFVHLVPLVCVIKIHHTHNMGTCLGTGQ
jgi:hypothetical protein